MPVWLERFEERKREFERLVAKDAKLLAYLWDAMQGRGRVPPLRTWQYDYLRKELHRRGLVARWEAMLRLKRQGLRGGGAEP